MSMRPLEELVNPAEDAWPLVVEWRAEATRRVEILPVDPEAARATLLELQVTTRSVLGALAYRTGGILVDGGFLRILGSGHPRIGGGLREWNASLGGEQLEPPVSKFMLVAYDALGGFFAINGGAWPGEPGIVHYWAPDTYEWESLEAGYAGFVEWAMSPQLDGFYDHLRWPGWEAEVGALGPDEAISIYPPLGLRGPDGEEITTRSHRRVPAAELWYFTHELARQTADLPDGATFEIDERP